MLFPSETSINITKSNGTSKKMAAKILESLMQIHK